MCEIWRGDTISKIAASTVISLRGFSGAAREEMKCVMGCAGREEEDICNHGVKANSKPRCYPCIYKQLV